MNQPPSFEPRKRRPRPSGDGAQSVGRQDSSRQDSPNASAPVSRPQPPASRRSASSASAGTGSHGSSLFSRSGRSQHPNRSERSADHPRSQANSVSSSRIIGTNLPRNNAARSHTRAQSQQAQPPVIRSARDPHGTGDAARSHRNDSHGNEQSASRVSRDSGAMRSRSSSQRFENPAQNQRPQSPIRRSMLSGQRSGISSSSTPEHTAVYRRSDLPTSQPPSFAPQGRNNSAPSSSSAYPPAYSPENPPRAIPPRTSPFRHSGAASGSYAHSQAGSTPVSYPPSHNAHGPASGAALSSSTSPDFSESNPDHSAPQPVRPRRRRRFRALKITLTVLLVFVIATVSWGIYLYRYGNSHLHHVAALSNAPDTPGTTYLIAGSDQRDAAVNDGTTGMRADTIMLLHKPESGPTVLVSLPRDTLVTYADSQDMGKLNAAYAYGGPEYLVKTVESLTGLTIDHFILIGMDGVSSLADSVGGINLCLDYDVNDELSGLQWSAGCHDADGKTALAFSRMRYSDPLGDIGRNQRQRQVVAKIIDAALSPGLFFNPGKQRELVGAAAGVLTVDNDASLMTVAKAGLALREAIGPDGLSGAPPIADLSYMLSNGQSTVLLAPQAEQFWADVRDGTVRADEFASF
ncbi:LCP family protein [Trueperella sp. LYQ143]|uniref:LCP family protein n=1 Tax=Trueperella sp. LYQ143 TaxID=3391059 RepID=UPI003983A383